MSQPLTIFRGYLANASAVLNTVTAGKKWVVTDITITSIDTVTQTATVLLDDIEIIKTQNVGAVGAAGNLLQWTGHQNLDAGKTVKGFGSVAAKLACHITGVEV